MAKRMKIRIRNNDEIPKRNEKLLKAIMKKMGIMAKTDFRGAWNLCCQAFGKYKKWSEKKVVDFLKKEWYGDSLLNF